MPNSKGMNWKDSIANEIINVFLKNRFMLSLKKIFCVLMLTSLIVNSVFCQTSNPQQYKYVFTVAKDGSGDYKFIQDAIDAMRVFPLAPITLYIKNGV